MNDRETVDRVLEDALLAVSAYVDLDEAAAAIKEGLQAVRKQLEALNATDYRARKMKLTCSQCGEKSEFTTPWKPDELARAAAHTMKVVDEAARLANFARGLPDTRPDMGGSNRDLLSLLTNEQLETFNAWIVAAQGRG
ncbi:MAG TPA: hypothetical protein VEA38_22085 [Terriglobales bacterium]|nr:hypothetical protein [Terriglobales bacterium]